MLPLERRRKIVEQISKDGSVKVIDLSKGFNVTEETIRRDLEKLEQEKILMRTYGGAVIVQRANEKEPFKARLNENLESKERIGQILGSVIRDGDVIMMDSGTTSLQVLQEIGRFKNLTIITNALGIISEMVQYDHINIIGIGGNLLRKPLAFGGPTTARIIASYYADKVILSCKGIDMEKGVMESNEIEADIKRAMVSASKMVVLAVDHTKFNNLSLIRIIEFSKVDIVVTDIKPSKEWMQYFKKMNIECLF